MLTVILYLMDKNEQDRALLFLQGIKGLRVQEWVSHDLGEQNRNAVVMSDNPEICTYYIRRNTAVLAVMKSGCSYPEIKYGILDWKDADLNYIERVFQRHHNIPWKICETTRCYIRETTEQDVDQFYEIYKEESITKYMENLYQDPKQEKQYITDYRQNIYAFYGFGMWTVCLKKTGEIIGRAGLSMREGYEEPELGYMIGVPWQRQGYGEEVCRGILEYGKNTLEFKEVMALMEKENDPSRRLCQKLGFVWKEKITITGKEYQRYLKVLT